MKTTITLEEDLSSELARAAQAVGEDMDRLVNDLLRQGLKGLPSAPAPTPKSFRQRTHDFGPPLRPNLDRVQHLADALDDEGRLRESGLLR